MKTFDYYDYYKTCPLAVEIENAMNDCGSAKTHLEKVKGIFSSTRVMDAFFSACIAYWSETEYYDGRNQHAVLTSRKIVENFAEIKDACELFKDDILLNAYGFTMSAHRYLQNELFSTIIERDREKNGNISKWLDEMEFVYTDDNKDLIPYKKYRMEKYGF